MTGDQWKAIYRRERERHGEGEALKTLLLGLIREAEYHRDADRANDLWNEVASEYPDLPRDGFRNYCIHKIPGSKSIFKNAD